MPENITAFVEEGRPFLKAIHMGAFYPKRRRILASRAESHELFNTYYDPADVSAIWYLSKWVPHRCIRIAKNSEGKVAPLVLKSTQIIKINKTM